MNRDDLYFLLKNLNKKSKGIQLEMDYQFINKNWQIFFFFLKYY